MSRSIFRDPVSGKDRNHCQDTNARLNLPNPRRLAAEVVIRNRGALLPAEGLQQRRVGTAVVSAEQVLLQVGGTGVLRKNHGRLLNGKTCARFGCRTRAVGLARLAMVRSWAPDFGWQNVPSLACRCPNPGSHVMCFGNASWTLLELAGPIGRRLLPVAEKVLQDRRCGQTRGFGAQNARAKVHCLKTGCRDGIDLAG